MSGFERLDPHAEMKQAINSLGIGPNSCFRFGAPWRKSPSDGLVDVAEDGQVSVGVAGEQMPLVGLAAIRVGLEG